VITEEVENQENVTEETGVESAEQPTPTPEQDDVSDVPDQEPQPEGEPLAAEPEYTPDYHYKVYGEEKEIPEMFRGLIKDKETEEQVRSYLSKADGFEPLKSKYETARTERDDFRTKFEGLSGDVQKLNHFMKSDRLAAYEMLGISQEQLLEDASKLINVREMEPEQRAEWERQRKVQTENYDIQNKMSFLEQQNQELMRQQHEFKLDQVLTRPEVEAVRSHYDSKFGAGAFKNKVVHNAYVIYNQTGEDLTPERAVQQMVDEYNQLGLNFNNNQAFRPCVITQAWPPGS